MTLKIVQDKLKTKNKIFPKIKNQSQITKKMDAIENGKLKNSLSNFLKVYNERNK